MTRDNNLRNRMKEEISREEVFQIISDNPINYSVVEHNQEKKVSNYIRMVILNEIIQSMNKRMKNSAVGNISRFMRNNQLNHITRLNNARDLAISFNGYEIKQFLKELGVSDLEEYICKYCSSENYEHGRR